MVCKICGKEFTPSSKSKVMCSDECRKVNQKMLLDDQAQKRKAENRKLLGTRFCDVCGTEFVPRTSRMIRCSPACSKKMHSKNDSRQERKERAEGEKVRKIDAEKHLIEFNVQALQEGKSYGKHELTSYLAKQSEEMAKRRRELDAEWERKRKNGNK